MLRVVYFCNNILYVKMICPFCKNTTKVVDKRDYDDSPVTRRRRECLSCKKRFTTYERMDLTGLVVIKKDGKRESFNIDKVKNGVLRAMEKRPIDLETINKVVNEIETTVRSVYMSEVTSGQIGEEVMKRLKELDDVAYIRFASVYRSFKDIETFRDEVNKLLKDHLKT